MHNSERLEELRRALCEIAQILHSASASNEVEKAEALLEAAIELEKEREMTTN